MCNEFSNKCRICGRPLKNAQSKLKGMGNLCEERHKKLSVYKKLINIKENEQ